MPLHAGVPPWIMKIWGQWVMFPLGSPCFEFPSVHRTVDEWQTAVKHTARNNLSHLLPKALRASGVKKLEKLTTWLDAAAFKTKAFTAHAQPFKAKNVLLQHMLVSGGCGLQKWEIGLAPMGLCGSKKFTIYYVEVHSNYSSKSNLWSLFHACDLTVH